jgi:hypothetical protein
MKKIIISTVTCIITVMMLTVSIPVKVIGRHEHVFSSMYNHAAQTTGLSDVEVRGSVYAADGVTKLRLEDYNMKVEIINLDFNGVPMAQNADATNNYFWLSNGDSVHFSVGEHVELREGTNIEVVTITDKTPDNPPGSGWTRFTTSDFTYAYTTSAVADFVESFWYTTESPGLPNKWSIFVNTSGGDSGTPTEQQLRVKIVNMTTGVSVFDRDVRTMAGASTLTGIDNTFVGVLITEIYYRPADKTQEWIEFYNLESKAVDIQSCQLVVLRDDDNNAKVYEFPTSTAINIPANSFWVIAYSGDVFYNTYGFYPDWEWGVDTANTPGPGVAVDFGPDGIDDTGAAICLRCVKELPTGSGKWHTTEVDRCEYGADNIAYEVPGVYKAYPDPDMNALTVVNPANSLQRKPGPQDTDSSYDDFTEYTPTPGAEIPEFFVVLVPIVVIIAIFIMVREIKRKRKRKSTGQ